MIVHLQTGTILLSPQSQSSSWDVIRGGYGPDVQMMDKAMRSVFERYTIDPQRCSIGGFSDGASYALSVGTTNGDLFTHIVAFSPGFMRPGYLVCPLIWCMRHELCARGTPVFGLPYPCEHSHVLRQYQYCLYFGKLQHWHNWVV